MTIRVYKSTDSGAPTLNGLGGSLLSVLTGCLVTGYGSQAAAGWSKPYETGNVGVYAPGAGGAFYLQIDDSVGRGTYGGRVAGVRIYESMSDAVTGIDPIPATGERYVGKSTAASSDARGWVLIADDQGFYLLTNISSAAVNDGLYYQRLHWFGRLHSTNAADAWAVCVSAAVVDGVAAVQTVSMQMGRISTSPSGVCYDVQRDFSGSVKSPLAAHLLYLGDDSALLGYNGQVVMESADDWLLYPAPVIGDAATSGYKRAFLPGLWFSLGRGADHDRYAQAGLLVDGPNGSDSLFALSTQHSSLHVVFFVDLVDWGRV